MFTYHERVPQDHIGDAELWEVVDDVLEPKAGKNDPSDGSIECIDQSKVIIASIDQSEVIITSFNQREESIECIDQ